LGNQDSVKIAPLTPDDYPAIRSMLQAFPDVWRKACAFPCQEDVTRTMYLISSNEKPAGWIALGKIEPGVKGEFGIAAPSSEGKRIAVKAAVTFMMTAFQVYKFKTIFSIPIDSQAEKALLYVGFTKTNDVYEITRETLERKWARWKPY
jgi:hypothetical protein